MNDIYVRNLSRSIHVTLVVWATRAVEAGSMSARLPKKTASSGALVEFGRF